MKCISPFILLALFLSAVAALAGAASVPARAQQGPVLALEPFVAAGQIDQPTDIASAGDDRLFVVERTGRIRVVQSDGTVLDTPFLDISDRVVWSQGGEQGLLGLVFHPNYAENGYFYVNYTSDSVGSPVADTHIARFQVTADPNVADPNSEHTILLVEQPFENHNAGDLAFGPADGYLYVPLGDGGSGNDPGNRAQNTGVLLGKMLRLDVDAASPAPDCGTPGNYAIPADNPFAGDPDACDEIWAVGLRNPWRISFDRLTNDLYIADVGQNMWEEVNFQPSTSTGGENYGWSCFEGTHENARTNMTSCNSASAYQMPVFEYSHLGYDFYNCAVTGGYVYRGTRYPALQGHYLLADFCGGFFWSLDVANGWQPTFHDRLSGSGYATFGEAANGELYVASLSDGSIMHVVDGTPVMLENPLYLPVVVKP